MRLLNLGLALLMILLHSCGDRTPAANSSSQDRIRQASPLPDSTYEREHQESEEDETDFG